MRFDTNPFTYLSKKKKDQVFKISHFYWSFLKRHRGSEGVTYWSGKLVKNVVIGRLATCSVIDEGPK